MHEAGIVWFQDKSKETIIIALPEITPDKMYGFLNGDYKIRNLGKPDDIAALYEIITKKLGIPQEGAVYFMSESNKLIKGYNKYIATR